MYVKLMKQNRVDWGSSSNITVFQYWDNYAFVEKLAKLSE